MSNVAGIEDPLPGTISFIDYRNANDPPNDVKYVWVRDPHSGELVYIPASHAWVVSFLTWSRLLDMRGVELKINDEGSLIYELTDGRKLVVISDGDGKIDTARATDTHTVTNDHYAAAKVLKELSAPGQDLTHTFMEVCVKELVKRGIRRPVQELLIAAGSKILWLLVVDGQVKIMTQDGKYFLLPQKKTITFNGFSITVL